MPNRQTNALSLGYADVVTILIAACEISPNARTPFDARLRHLQRLGVPPRGDNAAGRIHYGIAELAALATAIRLMDAFMPPALAARYVTERWTVLAAFMLAGAVEVLPTGYLTRRSIPPATFAVFRANALAALGKRRQHDERGDEPLGIVRAYDEERAAAITDSIAGAGLVLDSRTYMPTIVQRWTGILSATDAELAVELDRLRFAGAD